MHETYLTVDEFARFEGLAAATVRKQIGTLPTEKLLPNAGRGKAGGALLSSALLSSKGFQRLLACPAQPIQTFATAQTDALEMEPEPPAPREVDLNSLTAAQRDVVLFWQQSFNEFERLLALRRDWTQSQAADEFGATLPDAYRKSARVFLRRFRAWKSAGLAALLPKVKTGRPTAPIHPELKKWMVAHYIKKTKGRSRRLSANAAINKAIAEDWRPCPSRATLERLLADVPGNVLFGARGRKALDDQILPATLRDYSEPAMWLAVGDHHRFDIFVRCQDGKARRLWCTLWLDHRSRVALGWTINEQPSSYTIADAFRRMALRYGVPEVLEIDNGADYIREQLIGNRWQTQKKRVCSESEDARLRGAFETCGVQRIVRAIVKNAKSKLVERFFETVEEQFGKGLPGYCGKDAVERKKIEEALGHPVEESPDLLEEDDFRDLFGRWIEEGYHQHVHTGAGMNGRSPAQCFQAEVREVAHAPQENLDLLFLEPKKAVMQRQGFLVLGGWYRNPDMQHKFFNPELNTAERTFIIRYDRGDLAQVRVYDRQDVFVGLAPRINAANYDSEDELKRRKREHRRYADLRNAFWDASEDMLDAEMTAAEQIGLPKQAVVNGPRPSASDAKVTRYVLKAKGPEMPATDGVKPAGQVIPLERKTPTDLERRIAQKLKANQQAAAQPPPEPKAPEAADRIAERLKARYFQ